MSVVEFKLEAVSGTTDFATVTRWLRGVGESVSAAEPIVEIEVDKVAHELNPPVDGTVVELMYEDGDEVQIGEVLALIEVQG